MLLLHHTRLMLHHTRLLLNHTRLLLHHTRLLHHHHLLLLQLGVVHHVRVGCDRSVRGGHIVVINVVVVVEGSGGPSVAWTVGLLRLAIFNAAVLNTAVDGTAY